MNRKALIRLHRYAGWFWLSLSAPSCRARLMCCSNYRFLPESFRWYYGHDRIEEAERVIKAVSKVNGRPTPDMEFMEKLQVSTKDKKYTIFDIFRTRFLIKVSLLLALNWYSIKRLPYLLWVFRSRILRKQCRPWAHCFKESFAEGLTVW